MSPRVLTRTSIVVAVATVAAVVWLVGHTQRTTITQSMRQTQAAQAMLTAMVDQETGLRGFMLNRSESFLAPYQSGDRHYQQLITDLRRATDSSDQVTHDLIDRADEAARAWHGKAETAIAKARATGKPSTLSDAVERKAIMDGFRRTTQELLTRLDSSRASALDRATRLSAVLVLLLAAGFGGAGWLVFGRRANARARRDEIVARHRDEQSAFARALQFMDTEADTHGLVKRHLERTIPASNIVVLQRNNSADRLEAVTATDDASPFTAALADAAPRDCLAMRLGRTYESALDELMSCALCGKTTSEMTTCTPLLVQGEVTGALLVKHDRPLGADCRTALDETVTQSAPVLANMRNLAIAELRASTDALTGLPNRRSINDAVRRMMAQAGRTEASLAVVAIDLDHFKRINDHFGHDKGDDVLAAAAQTLAGTLRVSDFVGRQGGEEFVALLPATGLEGALSAAENLRANVAMLTIPGVDLPISASFGVAVFPEDGMDAESLLRSADRALYAAKAAGRNRVATTAALGSPEVPA